MAKAKGSASAKSNYPRHPLERVVRIPKAIIEQNAGKPASPDETAKYVGLKKANGVFNLELSSATKYGLISRGGDGKLSVTDLAKQLIRPKSDTEKAEALAQTVINAPVISEVYLHYRGEYLPQPEFLRNALLEKFNVPADKLIEFKEIFTQTVKYAGLLLEVDGKIKLANNVPGGNKQEDARIEKLSKGADVKTGDTCFVVMPFASPIGSYYSAIYEPAIKKAGLTPIRADNEIFGTGKIIDQIFSGIKDAKVLVAELTDRNPNVFYELGLAHALKKPVVLVSAKEEDVPFDVKHIRVIYYDVYDPFWGQKLIDKVAENIISALKTPEEAVIQFSEK